MVSLYYIHQVEYIISKKDLSKKLEGSLFMCTLALIYKDIGEQEKALGAQKKAIAIDEVKVKFNLLRSNRQPSKNRRMRKK